MIFERDLIALIKLILYHYDCWPEEPHAGLEYYLQFHSPWLARLIVKHDHVRVVIANLRRFAYVRCMIVLSLLHAFICSPVAVLQNYKDTTVVVENLFFIGVAVMTVVAFLSWSLKPHETKTFVEIFVRLSELIHSSDTDFRDKVQKAYRIWSILYFLFHSASMCVVVAAIIIFNYFHGIPQRSLYIRSWFPFDVKSYPNFEIALFLETIYCLLAVRVITSLIYFFSVFGFLESLYLNYINLRIANIQQNSVLILQKNIKSTLGTSVMKTDNANTDFLDSDERKRNNKITGNQTLSIKKNRVDPHNGASSSHVDVTDILKTEFDSPGSHVEDGIEDVDEASTGLENVHFDERKTTRVSSLQKPMSNKHGGDHAVKIDCNEDDSFGFDERFDSKAFNKEILKELYRCAEFYALNLRARRMLMSMLNGFALVEFMCYVTGAGITSVMVLSADKITIKEAMFIIIFIGFVFITFFVHFAADHSAQQSYAVAASLYQSDWVSTSHDYKKAMLILMLIAGGSEAFKPTALHPLTLQEFGQISVQSFKMVATLRQMFNK